MLEALLTNAPALSGSLANVAENLSGVDGSFTLIVERDLAQLTAFPQKWSEGIEASVPGQGSRATQAGAAAVARYDGLGVQISRAATTAVGSLQSADITGSFNGNVLDTIVTLATDSGNLTLETGGGVDKLVAMQNVSLNTGEIVAAVNFQLADTQMHVGLIETTAIGALQNGALQTSVDLSATIRGQMGDVTASSAAILNALVGQ